MIDNDIFDSTEAVEVYVGVPLDGIVRTWNDGRPQTWRVSDAECFSRLWGTGAVTAAAIERGHYRDIGVLDPVNNLLCIETTTPASSLGGHIDDHEHFALTPVDPAAPSYDEAFGLWVEYEKVLVTAMAHAFERGDVLIVSGQSTDGRSVTIGRMTRSLRRVLITSASPAPRTDAWPDPRPGEEDRTTLVTTACADTLFESTVQTTLALDSWGIEPLDARITYVVPIEAMTVELPWCVGDAA
ncbi:hypothetical protein [Gordonia spumicola]|nr:hypothetical protein [Gordonia spumicola]